MSTLERLVGILGPQMCHQSHTVGSKIGAVAIDENEASGISLQQLGDWLFRHSDNAIAAWRSTFPDDVRELWLVCPVIRHLLRRLQ